MLDCNIYTLEDGFEYELIDTLEHDGTKYYLLSEVDNDKNICIRKIIEENTLEYFSLLNDEEFDIIYEKFVEKNKDFIE